MPTFDFKTPISEQLQTLKAAIRDEPSKAELRVYYFQLLVVMGEWSKALEQLQLCAQLDPQNEPMARAYREAIRCEVLRMAVFAGQKRPFILGEPPEWMGYLLDALALAARGETAAASALRQQALDQAPACPGHINDQDFAWLLDGDSQLGPVCELFANGCYYWVPFNAISQIALGKPQDLRDLVWSGCEVTLANGGNLPGFIPTRYPVQASDSDAVRLGRSTEWLDLGKDHAAGRGQRSWFSDQDQYALLDVRHIRFAAA
jgi:type VI secretion system protein ImpE